MKLRWKCSKENAKSRKRKKKTTKVFTFVGIKWIIFVQSNLPKLPFQAILVKKLKVAHDVTTHYTFLPLAASSKDIKNCIFIFPMMSCDHLPISIFLLPPLLWTWIRNKKTENCFPPGKINCFVVVWTMNWLMFNFGTASTR